MEPLQRLAARMSAPRGMHNCGWRARAARLPLFRFRISKRPTTRRVARSRSFRGWILRFRPARWWPLWASPAREKALFCTFWARLILPPREPCICASTNVAQLSAHEAAAFRNREIGYVWQFHYLLPEFTALENVAMPLLARGVRKRGGAGSGGELAEGGGLGGSRRPSARRTLRRRAAARGAGSRAGQQSPAACWPTSRPAIWTKRRPAASLT